jgi:hypothetical protein
MDKKSHDASTGRIFLQYSAEYGHQEVINNLSNRIRNLGCPIGPSEEMEASIGIAKMSDEPDVDVGMIKVVLKSYLTKSNSCSQVFDRAWDRYFRDLNKLMTIRDERKDKLKKQYTDEFVEKFLQKSSTNIFKKMANKHTFIVNDKNQILNLYGKEDKSANLHVMDEEATKLGDKIYDDCKLELDNKGLNEIGRAHV